MLIPEPPNTEIELLSFDMILAKVADLQSTQFDRKIGIYDMLARLEAEQEGDIPTLTKNLLDAKKFVQAVAELPEAEASRGLVDRSIEEVVRRLAPNPLSAGLSRAFDLRVAAFIAGQAHRYSQNPLHVVTPLMLTLLTAPKKIKNEIDYANAAAALLICISRSQIKDAAPFNTGYLWLMKPGLPVGQRVKRLASVILKTPELDENFSSCLAAGFTETVKAMHEKEPVAAEDCLKAQKERFQEAGRTDLIVSLIMPTEITLSEKRKSEDNLTPLAYYLNEFYGPKGINPAISKQDNISITP